MVEIDHTTAYGQAVARLNPYDWVRAAQRRLGADGIDQVRVEVLAKDLGVSKGSFYWHFEDRAALLAALLAAWELEATRSIIDEVEAAPASPRERLWALMRRVFLTPPGVDLFETAVRAWAARDEAARGVVGRVDRQRVRYVKGLLGQLGLSAAESRRRAELMYRALIGEFVLRSYGTRPISGASLRALHETLVAPDEPER